MSNACIVKTISVSIGGTVFLLLSIRSEFNGYLEITYPDLSFECSIIAEH